MAITVTGGPAYGLSWNKTTDAYTRVASAAGLTAGAAFNAPSGGAWGLRRCNLWDTDGTVTAYYGDRCYTDTDVTNMGQCMVQIPKFYYYMEYDAGTTTYYWFVTTVAATTINVGLGVGAQAVKIHPAFTRDTATRNNIYLSAYEASLNGTMLESKAGVAPKVSYSLTQHRTAARARVGAVANKWEVQDYLSTCAIQLLYLIEYGGFNSQLLLGGGLAAAASVTNTGLTTAYGNSSYGVVAPDYVHAMSYRGIENFYGNIYRVIDGLHIEELVPAIANHDFNDTYASVHPYVISTAQPLWTVDGTIGDIKVDATYDYGFLPSAVGGTAATKLCDGYSHAHTNKIAMTGGPYNGGTANGMFGLALFAVAADALAYAGSRLMYIG